ncbi:T-cell surface glycoprotein CD3 gamma chain-like [Cyrtonyx montezumae]|uniref:T-cell surface glycoprotein CD3 gamma chain-like n=1 Tax=Cyrtonyx montezumae TaxID=9017 RepID=UPI0032DB81B0
MWKGRALGTWVLLASVAVGIHGVSIVVKEISGKVFLQCKTDKEEQKSEITWHHNGEEIGNTTQLDLGAIYDDPRGTYTCSLKSREPSTLQVHYRMCQNCIEVDAPTISGIVVADVIATVFLAIAVYCITGQDKGRMSRASDRQNLIANDQLYQPLGERSDGQYSQLATAKARK